MHWSIYDTLVLLTGIVFAGMALLPLQALTPQRRTIFLAVGGGLIVLSIITGSLTSMTYPWVVWVGPLVPVGVYLGLAQKDTHAARLAHVQEQARLARDARVAEAESARAASVAPTAPSAAATAAAPEVTSTSVSVAMPVAPAAPAQPIDGDAQRVADADCTPAALAEIAFRRPDLRPAIAGHPRAYGGLLVWLNDLDDPELRAIIRTRNA